MLTQEVVKSLFIYDTLSGVLTRRNKASSIVGNLDTSTGYLQTEIQGKKYYVHRLIFLYMENILPKKVDHIDRNRINNAWSNLREASNSQNLCNASLRSDNSTGYKGVSLLRGRGYQTYVDYEGSRKIKKFSFSTFNSKEETLQAAITWSKEMRELLHGEYHAHK